MVKKYLNSDIVIGILIIILSFTLIINTEYMPEEASMFPNVVLRLSLTMGLILAIIGVRKVRNIETQKKESSTELNNIKNPLIVFGIILGFAILFRLLGFYISSAIFIVIYMMFYGERRIKVILPTALLLNAGVFILFEIIFKASLPKGILSIIGGVIL